MPDIHLKVKNKIQQQISLREEMPRYADEERIYKTCAYFGGKIQSIAKIVFGGFDSGSGIEIYKNRAQDDGQDSAAVM